MAKYTNTPMSFFLEIPIDEFKDWMEVVNAEVKRENEEMKGGK